MTGQPADLSVVVEGWRGILHSYAVVNQYQLLEMARRDAIVICPFGSVEQHGPHLPVEVDSMLGETVALRSLREKATLSRRLASQIGPGMLHRRYIDVADEAERAVNVLGKRLSEATSDMGERGDG